MTSTLQTTIVQLLGQTLSQCIDPDPNNDLCLTEAEHADLLEHAAALYMTRAEAILAPYGCTILGNGDIILTDIAADDLIEWDSESVREELATIETSEVLPE